MALPQHLTPAHDFVLKSIDRSSFQWWKPSTVIVNLPRQYGKTAAMREMLDKLVERTLELKPKIHSDLLDAMAYGVSQPHHYRGFDMSYAVPPNQNARVVLGNAIRFRESKEAELKMTIAEAEATLKQSRAALKTTRSELCELRRAEDTLADHGFDAKPSK